MFVTLGAKVALLLTLAMLSGALGTWLARNLENIGVFIALLIYTFAGIFITDAMFHAGPFSGGIALCIWSAVIGAMSGPLISKYVHEIGGEAVLGAFLGTAGIMAVCGAIATFSGINFGGLGGVLTLGLWIMIIVGVIYAFVGMSRKGHILHTLAGIVLFSGYFLYDFWRLAFKSENSWQDAGRLTMNLYLNFWNMLLYVLELIAASKDKGHAMIQGATETMYAMVIGMPDTLHHTATFAGHAMSAVGLC
jgi:FtsH-binding integral membrane protein